MADRERLPNRRASVTLDFEHVGLRYSVTFSCFADGRPGEVFLNNDKHSSQSDMWARDCGILASFCLQHGVPLEEIRNALERDGAGQPTSPIGVTLDMIAKG